MRCGFLQGRTNNNEKGEQMCQRNPKRWNSKFAKFVGTYGVRRLAKELGVDQSVIYHWIRGVVRPVPDRAAAIQRLARESGRRLTIADIYEHAHNRRATDPTVMAAIERRKESIVGLQGRKAAAATSNRPQAAISQTPDFSTHGAAKSSLTLSIKPNHSASVAVSVFSPCPRAR